MSQRSEDADGVPRFTIVSAVYQVAAYLDDFIASIEAQDFPLDRVEVIMVDDGSTDAGPQKLREWQRRRPELVTVLTKANGGQASARNLGLEHARGEWVTLPDPDDTLGPDYFSSVDKFLTTHPDVQMVATNRILVMEATGKEAKHPLARYFALSDRMRNLDQHSKFFHGSAPAAFFRTAVLAREQLRFDERIRPNFEDGHFCSSYLLRVPSPIVAFMRSAKY
ncbi:MAG: glycosyltransferase family A protein, partial [Jatrophihabitans sp.]